MNTRKDYELWCISKMSMYYKNDVFDLKEDGTFVDDMVEICYQGWLYDMTEYGKVCDDNSK